jgi:SprT protein
MQLQLFKEFCGALLPRRFRTEIAGTKPEAKPSTGKGGGLVLAVELTQQAAGLARGAGCRVLASNVRVYWHSRLCSTAGMACYQSRRVLLNPELKKIGQAEIDRTLKHELAHLIAKARAGSRKIPPHGIEWQKACADLGIRDESRCHSLPLKKRTMRRNHHYQCPACGTVLARVRPFRHAYACIDCCRQHNRGNYDARFRFVKIQAPANPPNP